MISVLLCTLNRPVLIKNCISSLLSQSYRDFEIIVVDQSLDDETKKSCKSFADERIKYHHVSFTGLSRARNYGLKYCKGEYVCLGDDDAEYDPFFFDIGFKEISRCKKEIILCGRLKYLDNRKADALDYRGYTDGQRLSVNDMLKIGCSATLIIPTKELNKQGGFDESFGVGARYGSGEETDVVLRLFKQGIQARYLADMRVYHGNSDEDPSKDLKKVYKYYIGLGALLKKHLWYGKNLALLPKAARATIGAWIKWITGDAKQKAVYRMRLVGVHKGFIFYTSNGD